MTKSINLEKLRLALSLGHIEWQRHCLERLMERFILRKQVIDAILNGERIEDYLDDKPFPSALFLSSVGSRRLHVVAAFDSASDRAFIITVYEPDLDHFESDFKTRRKK